MTVHDPVQHINEPTNADSAAKSAEVMARSGTEMVVWRNRADCDGMNHPEILASMVAEAAAEGYEPCDLNYAGLPNIYLRAEYGHYDDGVERWHHDGFAMLVSTSATDRSVTRDSHA